MGVDAQQPRQEVRFCRAPDGVRIAYAVHDSGPPLVVDSCWLSHLQYDWQSPVWRHYLDEWGSRNTVIRFDERGHGLSDRDVTDHSLEARLGDLEAVVDDAGLASFALLAMAQGGPVAIAYTALHTERVSRLVFYGSYACGSSDDPEEQQLNDTFDQLIKVGWARPDSAFRRVFTSLMIPRATEEQHVWLDELQRVSTSAETARASRRQRRAPDSTALLGALDVPTLVLHSRGDRMNPFEEARRLTAGIAGARLVALESDNHIVLEDEPAWQVFCGQRRDRRGGRPQHPHRRAPPEQRLRQARPAREVGTHGCRGPPAHPRLSLARPAPPRPAPDPSSHLHWSRRHTRTRTVADDGRLPVTVPKMRASTDAGPTGAPLPSWSQGETYRAKGHTA